MQSGPNGSNCLNPIVNFTNIGSAFWGQKTSQRMASAMDRVNVVRMVLYARKIIATASKYVVFDPNDTKTWSQLRGICNPVLRDIASKRGLYEFKVVIDETTNTPDIIDQNRLYGKIYLKPTKTAEVIELDFIITSTGANFEEI
jgi:phage tail sheath protein FI